MKCCALFVALLIVAGAAARANPIGLSDNQLQRLQHGEVVVLDVLPPGGSMRQGRGGTAVTLVNASPETVWRVLVDYPRHSELYPRVTSSEVLEADADHTLVRYVVGVGPFSFGLHVNNYPDESRGRLEWRLDRDRRNGLFRDSWGYWQVESRGAGVLLTYAMAARTMLPAFLVRGAEHEGLVETVKAVRERAEQSR
jgi:ribosome-associated toxin RatA of RatAB toxin-antitoxin module